MAGTPVEHAEQARLALRTIVAEHGPGTLSDPRVLANLLADLLPDAPRIARILVAAAQDRIADDLREHTSVGMDSTTASQLVASSFADATMFTPQACTWVVGEIALALGLIKVSNAPLANFGSSATARFAPAAVTQTDPQPVPTQPYPFPDELSEPGEPGQQHGGRGQPGQQHGPPGPARREPSPRPVWPRPAPEPPEPPEPPESLEPTSSDPDEPTGVEVDPTQLGLKPAASPQYTPPPAGSPSAGSPPARLTSRRLASRRLTSRRPPSSRPPRSQRADDRRAGQRAPADRDSSCRGRADLGNDRHRGSCLL